MLKHGVQETTVTAGTGTLTLTSAVGYSRFADRFSVGESVSYLIENGVNKEWGIGTVGAANTLARTTITGSLVNGTYTAGGTAITLVGTSTVACVEHEASGIDAHVAAADPHPVYTTAAEAAAAAPVQSVAGRTGAVTLAKADVGLANVDNTTDLGKPISTATQTALDNKIVSAATASAFPVTGDTKALYVALDTGIAYRWTGAGYVLLGSNTASGFPAMWTPTRTGFVDPVTGAIYPVGGLDLATDTITITRTNNTAASTAPIVEIVNGQTWTRTVTYNSYGEVLSIGAATVT